MERPMSMPLKEYLIKKLSLKLNISERIIDVVITDQFTSAFRATSTHNSIELSGLGKFVFNMPKAQRYMNKYLSQMVVFNSMLEKAITEKEAKTIQLKLNTAIKNIDHLKPKLDHGTKTNI
jgi:nucleoid DNA-binding protein